MPTSTGAPVTSAPGSISNEGGYTFTGDVRNDEVDIIGPTVTGDPNDDDILGVVPIKGDPNAILVSNDLSRVFVATDEGIAVIDGFDFQYYGQIVIGNNTSDDDVTALAISPDDQTLYAAVAGMVYSIDINVGDLTQTKYVASQPLMYKQTPIPLTGLSSFPAFPNSSGLINSLAVNSTGTELYVGAPGSRLIGGDGDASVVSGACASKA